MRKSIIIFFTTFILLSGLLSCKKLVKALFPGMDVNSPEVQITVPPIVIVSATEQSFGSYTYHFNLDSTIRANTNNGFNVNDVGSIKVKQISINITNADQLNNLANFESARVTLQSNTNTTPVEIISQTLPDTYASTFTATPANGPELLSYSKGSDITYTIYGKMRRVTNKSLNVVVSVILRLN
ncbi:MAG: hypothetical protein H0W12_10315 [Chitinophagaceae bacterium]|nr:hypothetical protein [Chitinophagaceae bacterium]